MESRATTMPGATMLILSFPQGLSWVVPGNLVTQSADHTFCSQFTKGTLTLLLQSKKNLRYNHITAEWGGFF